MEKLSAAGFASTASVVETLPVDASDKAKLCEAILTDAKAIAAGPGTPAGMEASAKVKSEAPTPAAERDSSPIIAKMPGVSFLAPRGKFDVEFRQSSLSFVDKNGALAATCPISSISAVFDMAVPAGAQKIKTFCVATGLKEAVTVGKSQLKVLAMQVKETENCKVDVKGESPHGKTLEGLQQETGMGFSVLSGPTHEVMASLIAYVAGKNVEKHKPETFLSVARDGAVKCNIKAVHDGFLFFHKLGLLFIQKFVYIPKSEIRSVDFTGTTGRTFDLQVQTTSGEKHDFSMIAKEEHQRVAEYVQLMKFKNAQQAAAAGSGAEVEGEKKTAAQTVASQGHDEGKAAVMTAEEEEDAEDSDDDDDEDFDADADSDDESEGYDAIEAMDADAIQGDDDEGGTEDEDEEGEDEEDDEGSGEGNDSSNAASSAAGGNVLASSNRNSPIGAKRLRDGDGDDDDEGAGGSGGAHKRPREEQEDEEK